MKYTNVDQYLKSINLKSNKAMKQEQENKTEGRVTITTKYGEEIAFSKRQFIELQESYNKAIDDAIEVVKVEYAKSGFGLQSPISSPLQGTSRGSMATKIISQLQQLKKK